MTADFLDTAAAGAVNVATVPVVTPDGGAGAVTPGGPTVDTGTISPYSPLEVGKPGTGPWCVSVDLGAFEPAAAVGTARFTATAGDCSAAADALRAKLTG